MTNEKNRRQDIFALAARIKQAKADWEKCDLSEFSLGDVSNLGIPNYAIAKALYDSGYRMTALDEVTVIVKDGRVTNVYASNDALIATMLLPSLVLLAVLREFAVLSEIRSANVLPFNIRQVGCSDGSFDKISVHTAYEPTRAQELFGDRFTGNGVSYRQQKRLSLCGGRDPRASCGSS